MFSFSTRKENNRMLINGNDANNQLKGTSSDDSIYAMGGNDKVNGGRGNDFISGGLGDDKINGDEGDDLNLFGDAGNDTINGGKGNDRLIGAAGTFDISIEKDVLTGGKGADVFGLGQQGLYYYFDFGKEGKDSYAVITDYNLSEGDKIEVAFGSTSYTLIMNNFVGGSAMDTLIYSQGGSDLFGVVQDTAINDISITYLG
jgi:Ca2+-binding RTX toxin-like protein